MKSGNTASLLPSIAPSNGFAGVVPFAPVISPFGAGTAPSYGSAITLAGDAGAAGVSFVPDQSVSAPNFSFQAATVVGAGRQLNNTWGFSFPGYLGNPPPGTAVGTWRATMACWFKLTTKAPNNYSYMVAMVDQASYRQIFAMGLDGNEIGRAHV